MVFSKTYETKWHDTDANRFLRPSALLTYLEETSGLHMCSVGRSLDDVRDREGLAFILSRLGMNFYEPISPFREIRVETWVNESHGYSSVRQFRLFDGERLAVEASTTWALIDLSRKFPVKTDQFDFGFSYETEVLSSVPTRIHISKETELALVGERKIGYSDIDYNYHMNNTRYPDMLCDFLPDMKGMRVSSMMLSFLREAGYGHTLGIYRGENENRYLFRTKNEAGETCLEAGVKLVPLGNS